MSPRTKEQVEILRRQSKERILDAALSLFGRHGFAATSVSAIATEAGVSKGLLYNYFASKDELLLGIVQGAMEATIEVVPDQIDPSVDPKQLLSGMIDRVFQTIRANEEYWRLVTRLSLQEGILEKVEEHIRRHHEMQLQLVIELFKSMGRAEPEKEAYLLAATLDGMVLQWLAMVERFPLQQQIDYLKERFDLIAT